MAVEDAAQGSVVSVNISEAKGTSKHPVPEIRIDERGVAGDAHAGDWHRQVSLLALESIERFSAEAKQSFGFGEFAENITASGIDLREVVLLDRLKFGASVELEVIQLGKECHGSGCAIFQQVGRCVMPKEGVFTRVISGGIVRAGDVALHERRTLRCRVITLSDRAAQGIYPDRSGPRIGEHLRAFAAERKWQLELDATLIPDDAALLRAELIAAREAGILAVFTTGGTGLGPRDVAPDVVADLADKTIPGIMEFIRTKYGAEKPNALLSRSIAAVAARTIIYTLPGSVKAVDEYMGEILKTLEHLIFTIQGLDTH